VFQNVANLRDNKPAVSSSIRQLLRQRCSVADFNQSATNFTDIYCRRHKKSRRQCHRHCRRDSVRLILSADKVGKSEQGIRRNTWKIGSA